MQKGFTQPVISIESKTSDLGGYFSRNVKNFQMKRSKFCRSFRELLETVLFIETKNSDLRGVFLENEKKKIKNMGQKFSTDFFEVCRQKGQVE